MRNIMQLAFDCTLTSQTLEELISKEENFEYMYNYKGEQEMEDEQTSYPKWFNDILESPYERILECRQVLLDHEMDPRYIRTLDKAICADYNTRYDTEITSTGDATPSDIDLFHDKAVNYPLSDYYEYSLTNEIEEEKVEELYFDEIA
jgi:hypothetical protein